MLEEVEKYGHLIGIGGPVKSLIIKNVNDSLDIDDSNFDLATGKRPKGWNEVKLRRVYLKEWLDRKNGVDEETILARRPEREREVEAEMINEASVFNRVRAIEKRIKNNKNTAAIFPVGYKGYAAALKKDKKPAPSTSAAKSRPVSMAIPLSTLKAANSTMENLSELVCDTLAEKSLGNIADEVIQSEPKTEASPVAPSNHPPSMRIVSKRFESTPTTSSAPTTQTVSTTTSHFYYY
jgi:hypothetical protein